VMKLKRVQRNQKEWKKKHAKKKEIEFREECHNFHAMPRGRASGVDTTADMLCMLEILYTRD
jgi:hypothetical protein